MGAGTVWLIALLVAVGLVVAFIYLLSVFARGQDGLRREERDELRELRDLVARLDRLAYTHRETEPNLAFGVIDEINRVKRKELE